MKQIIITFSEEEILPENALDAIKSFDFFDYEVE